MEKSTIVFPGGGISSDVSVLKTVAVDHETRITKLEEEESSNELPSYVTKTGLDFDGTTFGKEEATDTSKVINRFSNFVEVASDSSAVVLYDSSQDKFSYNTASFLPPAYNKTTLIDLSAVAESDNAPVLTTQGIFFGKEGSSQTITSESISLGENGEVDITAGTSPSLVLTGPDSMLTLSQDNISMNGANITYDGIKALETLASPQIVGFESGYNVVVLDKPGNYTYTQLPSYINESGLVFNNSTVGTFSLTEEGVAVGENTVPPELISSDLIQGYYYYEQEEMYGTDPKTTVTDYNFMLVDDKQEYTKVLTKSTKSSFIIDFSKNPVELGSETNLATWFGIGFNAVCDKKPLYTVELITPDTVSSVTSKSTRLDAYGFDIKMLEPLPYTSNLYYDATNSVPSANAWSCGATLSVRTGSGISFSGKVIFRYKGYYPSPPTTT